MKTGRPKKLTDKQRRENINAWADEQAKILQVHEILWKARWNSARNPFEAWADWMSPGFQAIRAKINGPYIAAVRAREDAKRGKFK